MTTKAYFRRTKIAQRREDNFTLKQSVNQMIIPNYNALKDPYLSGFFKLPFYKKHLKDTGILPKKKGLSLKNFKSLALNPQKISEGQKSIKHRRAKSEGKKHKVAQSQQLAQMNQCITERPTANSVQLTRKTKVYKSVKKPIDV